MVVRLRVDVQMLRYAPGAWHAHNYGGGADACGVVAVGHMMVDVECKVGCWLLLTQAGGFAGEVP
jgi:hypothetical protein